jgi:catechol 2,3-dioxygenase-like lactoylglutathione lyase family enzyme
MKLIKQFKENAKEHYHLTFNDTINSQEAILELIYDQHNKQTVFPKDKNALEGYWKFSISIKDVEIARGNLIKQGVDVPPAVQVPNVAYLCHFYDPDGYCLELIQHKFEHHHQKEQENKNFILGNQPVLSLITYRVKDIHKSLDFYINTLGLKLYSKMDVSAREFELYFLAPHQESLPNEKDIQSLDNIEWMWQRPYTLIELQYIPKNKEDNTFTYAVGKKTGFNRLSFIADEEKTMTDPDGYSIEQKTSV